MTNRLRSKKGSAITLVFVLFMLTVLLLMLLAIGIVFVPSIPKQTISDSIPNDSLSGLRDRGEQWTEVLSWEPRAFIYYHFLSKDESDHLISLAKPHRKKSAVVDSKTGQSKDGRVRSSSGMFLRRGQDKNIRDIEKRIADFTFIPVGMRIERFLPKPLNLLYGLK